jgi:superfamily II RNA helicase
MAPSLAAYLPPDDAPPLSSDEILGRFVQYAADCGFQLYPAQEEAVLELLSGKHLVLATPTGSGKSLVAFALHFKALSERKRSFYTCPIKALVNEKFFQLCDALGPERVGMMTGDAAINADAPVIVCTAEVLANLCLRDAALAADYVVMDEFHYYADKERGVSWQVPLLLLERCTFLLMSATLGDTSRIEEALTEVTGRETAHVHSLDRPVPLDFTYAETPLHETLEKLVAGGKSPVYLVNFSQRAAAEQAQNLMSVNFSNKEEKARIASELEGFAFDTPFGKELQRYLRHGVGLHHAGLLPRYRLLVERLAQTGLLKVVSGTDTLGVGVNIPIRTVLFTQLCKYDGEKVGILSARDFKQLAGRAGRKGFDVAGSVVAQAPEHVVENLKLAEKEKSGKKVVKKQPPQRGYAHWDKSTFDKLQERPPEPLESRFGVTFGLLLALLQADPNCAGRGYGRLVTLIRRSHARDYVKVQLKKQAAQMLRTLREAGIIHLVKGSEWQLPHLRVDESLQLDFSLHHTLSLYLMDALPQLDTASESYALDVLTLVESILENPDVILYAQLDKAEGDKIAELKAKGVEYDERMAELEKVEWPKPNRDFVYGTFNLFAQKHPWVGAENIRPKSIVREMLTTYQSFHDYVREYGLQRSEGVLLRYLTESYKALAQNVPDAKKTEELEDIEAYLRTLVKTVDSSLVDEWERRIHPGEETARTGPHATLPPRKVRLADDPRKLAARVRSDLHRLLRALALKDYALASTLVHQPEPGTWTAEALEQAMAPFWEQHLALDITPRARRPDKTFLRALETGTWEARQSLVDPNGECDWFLDTRVDLREDRDEALPLIELVRVGS